MPHTVDLNDLMRLRTAVLFQISGVEGSKTAVPVKIKIYAGNIEHTVSLLSVCILLHITHAVNGKIA